MSKCILIENFYEPNMLIKLPYLNIDNFHTTFRMKIKSLPLVLIIWFLSNSCQKCILIEQTITGPVITCAEKSYINKSIPNTPTIYFSFNEFIKPIPDPFNITQLTGPHPIPTAITNIRSNFSAYDSIKKRYVFEYTYIDNAFQIAHIHHYDVNTNISTFFSQKDNFVSPVFSQGNLYAIRVRVDNFVVNYEVIQIDPLTGAQISSVSTKTITVKSPCTAATMSSVCNGGDLIYFLSGTNLIEVNVSTKTSRYIDIDPSFNATNNNVIYLGLEYKRDEGLLLALKNINRVSTLVSIKINPTPVLTTIFDIASKFPDIGDRQINPEFYSTTYDPCDNSYYISELHKISAPLSTYLIEVNLDRKEMKFKEVAEYFYGWEFGR